MTRLAEKAGTAGNSHSSHKKLGILASFAAAACMTLSAACAWATPPANENRATQPERNQTVGKTFSASSSKNAAADDSEWTIRLSGKIDHPMAEPIIDKLRALNRIDPKREITLIINSEGGSVSAGMAIYDTMQAISNDVRTLCEGRAMSMAAVLLASGTPGKRDTYGSCEIMIHEISTEIDGRLGHVNAWSEDARNANEKLIDVLHRRTGLSKEDLRSIMIVDIVARSTKEAKDMGLIDNVIPAKEIKPAAPRKLPGSFCDTPDRKQLGPCRTPQP